MSDTALATEATKNTIENNVSWFLSDKLQDPATTIATKKYLTNDNVLVYLTRCNVAELSVPRVKVQVLSRVRGGVHEVGYQMFSDHRFVKYVNDMIFGKAATTAAGDETQDVTEVEAQALIQTIAGLAEARQTL